MSEEEALIYHALLLDNVRLHQALQKSEQLLVEWMRAFNNKTSPSIILSDNQYQDFKDQLVKYYKL